MQPRSLQTLGFRDPKTREQHEAHRGEGDRVLSILLGGAHCGTELPDLS